MTKKTTHICTACGSVHAKWSGQCPACGAWDTVQEEAASKGFSRSGADKHGRDIVFSELSGAIVREPRVATGIEELDRALGGGLVKGSAILIGGDPGIGKSTLLLQVMARLALGRNSAALNPLPPFTGGDREGGIKTAFSKGANIPPPLSSPVNGGGGASRRQGDSGHSTPDSQLPTLKTAYITGEESIDQVKMRAMRLGVQHAPVQLAATTDVADIIQSLRKTKPDLVVIDSIQTMYINTIDSAPGTVSQVRTAAHELIQLAKQTGMTLILVGHVTKDGQIAGPKLLEHMVDTVLYFEGDRGHQFRILRAVKNRFGAAGEIGVFEMGQDGLQEVRNPSALFISGTAGHVAGSVVFPAIEGSRTVMVEVQALVCPTPVPQPRRAVVGWDINRLNMLLAVLQTRANMKLYDKEVYLNVAGGIRITEPAADLAVASAIISALTNIPILPGGVVFGEVGLSGEVRPVSQTPARLKEAMKLGFTSGILPEPPDGKSRAGYTKKNFSLTEIRSITQVRTLLGEGAKTHEVA